MHAELGHHSVAGRLGHRSTQIQGIESAAGFTKSLQQLREQQQSKGCSAAACYPAGNRSNCTCKSRACRLTNEAVVLHIASERCDRRGNGTSLDGQLIPPVNSSGFNCCSHAQTLGVAACLAS